VFVDAWRSGDAVPAAGGDALGLLPAQRVTGVLASAAVVAVDEQRHVAVATLDPGRRAVGTLAAAGQRPVVVRVSRHGSGGSSRVVVVGSGSVTPAHASRVNGITT
jgi:hypothetical protein